MNIVRKVLRGDLSSIIRIIAVVLCGASSASLVAIVVITIASRFPFPFELERMEGAFVDHARLIAQGGSVYSPPSSRFVGFIYTPLSYLAAAPLIAAGINGFQAARSVSLMGIAGGMLVGMLLVVRATGKRWLALAVPIMTAAHYFHVELYYDEARPDNLMSLFWMLSVAAFSLTPERMAIPLFVTFGTLTIFTKQTSLVMFAVLLIGSAPMWPRRALLSAIGLAATVGFSFLVMNHETNGGIYNYLVIEPRYHSFAIRQAFRMIVFDLGGSFGVTSLAALLCATAVVRDRLTLPPASFNDRRVRTRVILVIAALAGLVFSAASVTQPSVVRNVYIAYAVTGAAFLPVALDWAVTSVSDVSRRRWAATAALLVMAGVAGLGLRDPRSFQPTVDDHQPWLTLRKALRSVGPEERAWVTFHGNIWGPLESPMHAHMNGLYELVGGYYGPPTGFPMPPDLVEKINSRWFSAIVVADGDAGTQKLIEHRYALNPSLGEFRFGNFSMGIKTRMEHVWTPRN